MFTKVVKFLKNDQHHHSEIANEPDSPPNLVLFVALAVTAIVLVVTVIVLTHFFDANARDDISAKETSQPSEELLKQRQLDNEKLTSYDVIDESKGLYQIPIEQAIEKLARGSNSVSSESNK